MTVRDKRQTIPGWSFGYVIIAIIGLMIVGIQLISDHPSLPIEFEATNHPGIATNLYGEPANDLLTTKGRWDCFKTGQVASVEPIMRFFVFDKKFVTKWGIEYADAPLVARVESAGAAQDAVYDRQGFSDVWFLGVGRDYRTYTHRFVIEPDGSGRYFHRYEHPEMGFTARCNKILIPH